MEPGSLIDNLFAKFTPVFSLLKGDYAKIFRVCFVDGLVLHE